MKDIDAKASPVAMEARGVVFPVNEPLVLNLLGDMPDQNTSISLGAKRRFNATLSYLNGGSCVSRSACVACVMAVVSDDDGGPLRGDKPAWPRKTGPCH